MAFDNVGGSPYDGTPPPVPSNSDGTVEGKQASSKEPKVTMDDVIIARIAAGETFMRPHISKALRAGNRYLDSSARTLQTNRNIDGETRDLPVGEVNYMAMNIRQKVAGIAIGSPDVVVKMKEDAPDGSAELVRAYIRETWRKKKWGRILRRLLTARYVGGMGHLAYLWDRQKGFDIEFVEVKDFGTDPGTTQDQWDDPRWNYRYINIPRDAAQARYGSELFTAGKVAEGDSVSVNSPWANASPTKEKTGFRICLYYDETCEAEVYGGTVLKKTANEYDRSPIRTLVGDVNPNGDFPLGDFDTSLGVFEMMRRLQNIINNTAQNGGGIPWLRTEFIDEKIRQKVINGTHNGYVLVTGVPGEQAVGYTPNNPLNDAVLKAMQMMSQGLDADQGVSEYDRGVVNTNPKFATQAALLANRSGSRGNLARIDYEAFVEEFLNEMIRLTVKFGLDPQDPDSESDEAKILYEACQGVAEIRIIEESSSFKDPGMLQQQNLTLFQLATTVFPLMSQLGFPLNLKTLFDDVLRSFDKRDTDKYYLNQQEQMQMQQMQMQQQLAAQAQQVGGAPAQPGQPTTGQDTAPPQGNPQGNGMLVTGAVA